MTDRAGNVAVTLDYTGATNPPALQLAWPTNGMTLVGDSFYVRGQINDETASITAQMIDEVGLTNDYAGLVERNGTFWLEGLPLATGTNGVQLTATDAAWNITQTSMTLIKSDAALNITSTPDGESLYDGTGTVSGTVPDAGWSVSVNGVAATVNSGGDWTAENVPIYGEGTATFDVVATPTNGAPVHVSVEKVKPAIIKVTKHLMKQMITGPSYTTTWTKDYKMWQEDANGVRRLRYRGTASSLNSDASYGYYGTDYAWSDMNVAGTAYSYSSAGGSSTGAITGPLVMTVPDQQLDHVEHDGSWTTEFRVQHYYAKGVRHEWPSPYGSTVETLAARTEQTLFTGGKSSCGGESAYCLGVSALSYGKPESAAWYYTPGTTVSNELLSVSGRPVDLEGKLWALVADNSKAVLIAQAGGKPHYSAAIANQTPGLSLTVVSNATYVGSTNWAAVKATNEYVYLEVTLNNGNTNEVANVVWSANVEEVPGMPSQRRVSKSVSKKIPLTAKLGDQTRTVDVWILWATVTVKHSGQKSPPLLNGLIGNTANFPTNIPGPTLGPLNLLNGTNGSLAWKVEIQGKLTPNNVGRVVPMGWDFSQNHSYHYWVGATNSFENATNAPDGAFNQHGYGWKDVAPDIHDKVFALDAPGYNENPPTDYVKREDNFNVRVKWFGIDCSDKALWWVRQNVETTNGTPNVIVNTGGDGEIELSNEY